MSTENLTVNSVAQLAQLLGSQLSQHSWSVALAESCTGGLVCASLTEIAGSSAWFERGYITYSNQAKSECLGVSAELIGSFGAVSEEVAKAMAEGALKNSASNLAIAITGIAGPTGGSPEKPVGTVCFAWAFTQLANNKSKHPTFCWRSSGRANASLRLCPPRCTGFNSSNLYGGNTTAE